MSQPSIAEINNLIHVVETTNNLEALRELQFFVLNSIQRSGRKTAVEVAKVLVKIRKDEISRN